MHGCMRIFCGEYEYIQTGFLSTMHVQVCTLSRCCDISVHICIHARCRVCTCAYVCTVCSFSVGERGWGSSASLWAHLFLGVRVFLKEGEIGVLFVSFPFLTRVAVYVSVCVFIRTHTHTLHIWGTLLSAQGSGWDTWKAGRIQMDQVSAYMYSYVYKIHMRMYMSGGGMRSWTNCFLL